MGNFQLLLEIGLLKKKKRKRKKGKKEKKKRRKEIKMIILIIMIIIIIKICIKPCLRRFTQHSKQEVNISLFKQRKKRIK